MAILTPLNVKWKWLYITASGGEQNMPTPLVGNIVGMVKRDGVNYRKVDSDPLGKEFSYDPTTGDIVFDPNLPPFEPNESIAISYLTDFAVGNDPIIVSSVSVGSITDTSVTITWTTNVPTDSTVEYWITPDSKFVVSDSTLVTSHSVTITGLEAGTTYTFHIVSTDTEGNIFTSAEYTFTTSGTSGTPDTTPPVISSVTATNITSTSAIITWTTDEPANSRVQYGLTTSYGSQSTLNTTLVTSHSVLLTGLTPNTTYHFRVRSADAAGNVSFSGDFTFTTDAGVIILPGTTKMGAIIGTSQNVTDKVRVTKELLAWNYYRGARELLSQYTGQSSTAYTACKQRGMKLLLNANWDSPPNAVFCTNETLYKSKLNLLLNNYGGDASVIEMLVIENEPDNAGYYTGTGDGSMSAYITQLGWAIEVIHARGLKVADGCVHLIGLNSGGGGRAGQIINGINQLRISGKVLDYINIHTNLDANNGSDAVRNIIKGAQYYKDHTGIQKVMSNEWHVESSNSAAAVQFVQDCITAGLHYCVPYGGEWPWVQVPTTKAYPLNQNYNATSIGVLTNMGIDIKNAGQIA